MSCLATCCNRGDAEIHHLTQFDPECGLKEDKRNEKTGRHPYNRQASFTALAFVL